MISGAKSYIAPVEIGQVVYGGMVGEVVESNSAHFAKEDIVEGNLGWQEYALSNGQGLRKVDPTRAPISTALGVLGMPGMTAYFGLLEIGQPSAGETVVVSGAAGAVGSLVGQIAKIKGCTAVGIAGSDEKVRYITEELAFDGAFNYKKSQSYLRPLHRLTPNGIDVYFDNVGGAITDTVFHLINPAARIVVCGQISQYNLEEPEIGPRWLSAILAKRARVEGFLVFQFADRYEEGLRQMAQWIHDGKIKYRETITKGFENTAKAFIGMLKGENIGKQIVKL
jgi:NADPH:quinone reductase